MERRRTPRPEPHPPVWAHSLPFIPSPPSQVSDWDRRPLSARQVEYAALDARVLVRIYEALVGEGGEEMEGRAREVTVEWRAGGDRDKRARRR